MGSLLHRRRGPQPGTTRTSEDVRLESVKGSKADIDQAVGRGRTAGVRGASMALILKRASASRTSGEWNDDDDDVLADGVVVGRIMKTAAAPEGMPWMWTLVFGHHETARHRTAIRQRARRQWWRSPRVGGVSNARMEIAQKKPGGRPSDSEAVASQDKCRFALCSALDKDDDPRRRAAHQR